MNRSAEPVDPLLPGAVEHYEDATYYDWTYRRRKDDIAFYVRTAKKYGGPILELGGGSGRVAIPLVKDGHEVVLLDASKAMLEQARARAKEELSREEQKRLHIVEGDLRTFDVGRKFSLITAPFNVLLHLYEPMEFAQCFQRVCKHLSRTGVFVFDVRVPSPIELARNPERVYRGPSFKHPTYGYRVRYTEQFRYDPIKQVQHVTIVFSPGEDAPKRARPVEVLLSQRQLFPNEVRALLALGGLSLAGRYGDFTGRPLNEDDPQQIIVAKKTPKMA